MIGSPAPYANDWGVYEDKEFFWKTPGSYGRTWRCRRDTSATPSSDGPDVASRISGIQIAYRDGAGREFTVGPVGSNSDYETADLEDTDPSNPANRVQRKWQRRDIGISNQTMAVQVGQMLLTESNRIDWRGSVELEGEIFDEAGNPYAPWEMRAGDHIVFEDDPQPVARPIVSTSYTHDSMTVRADIGAPPKRGDVMFGQLAAAVEYL
jgi:hypothetical protein